MRAIAGLEMGPFGRHGRILRIVCCLDQETRQKQFSCALSKQRLKKKVSFPQYSLLPNDHF